MKALLDTVTLLVIGLLLFAIAMHGLLQTWLKANRGAKGAVVVRVAGKDYAANGRASLRYPPIQQIWNSKAYPSTNIDRLIVRGLTLCDWQPIRHSLQERDLRNCLSGNCAENGLP